jgi:hypothetical protein
MVMGQPAATVRWAEGWELIYVWVSGFDQSRLTSELLADRALGVEDLGLGLTDASIGGSRGRRGHAGVGVGGHDVDVAVVIEYLREFLFESRADISD